MNEPQHYWIWSNEHGAWWGRDHRGYVRRLQDAGRYSEQQADEIVAQSGLGVTDEQWPNEVKIAVTNNYLSRSAMEAFSSAPDYDWRPRQS